MIQFWLQPERGERKEVTASKYKKPGFHHGGGDQHSSEKSKPVAKQGHKVTDPHKGWLGCRSTKNLLGGFYK